MAKSNQTDTPSVNLLGTGTIIKGDIETNGDFRIDGTLIGSIKSKGKIVVGNSGNVEGEISCQNADISGCINAQIHVNELLSLKSSKIVGDIVSGKLAIEPGARFSGSCKMDNSSPANTRQDSSVNEKRK